MDYDVQIGLGYPVLPSMEFGTSLPNPKSLRFMRESTYYDRIRVSEQRSISALLERVKKHSSRFRVYALGSSVSDRNYNDLDFLLINNHCKIGSILQDSDPKFWRRLDRNHKATIYIPKLQCKEVFEKIAPWLNSDTLRIDVPSPFKIIKRPTMQYSFEKVEVEVKDRAAKHNTPLHLIFSNDGRILHSMRSRKFVKLL